MKLRLVIELQIVLVLGWAVYPEGVPQSVVFNLQYPLIFDHVKFLTSLYREDFHLTKFKLQVFHVFDIAF